jgi:HTH-type transcriptional regulator/antitoxin HigA
MEVSGLKQSDLAELLGSASRASEILNRKRALTTEMVYRISRQWNIPADSLVRPYHLEAS